jgi:hypothetical protein
LWDHTVAQGIAPAGLHLLDIPDNLQIDDSVAINRDLVEQVFDTAQGTEGWNPASNIAVKRCGVFSNFADGLIFSSIAGRIGLKLNAAIYEVEALTGTMNLTINSNLVNGTGLLQGGLPAGTMITTAGNITTPFYTRDILTYYPINATNGRLSGYARQTTSTSEIYKLTRTSLKSFTIPLIPALNVLYETEIFFELSNALTGRNVFLSAQLVCDSSDSKFDFYTHTINTALDGLPVTMDAVVEVELTQQ